MNKYQFTVMMVRRMDNITLMSKNPSDLAAAYGCTVEDARLILRREMQDRGVDAAVTQ